MSYRIIDITNSKEYERYLYKCISSMPFRIYKNREKYLENAKSGKFYKKILEFNKSIVGQIEFAEVSVSGLPIIGKNLFVMNCIWVLRKAKGNNFGKILLNEAIKIAKAENINGIATIALENHPSPWLKKEQIEKLGFKEIKHISLSIIHKEKYKNRKFKIYLMWFPLKEVAEKPDWDLEGLLKGFKFCIAHPLYHPDNFKEERIFNLINE